MRVVCERVVTCIAIGCDAEGGEWRAIGQAVDDAVLFVDERLLCYRHTCAIVHAWVGIDEEGLPLDEEAAAPVYVAVVSLIGYLTVVVIDYSKTRRPVPTDAI